MRAIGFMEFWWFTCNPGTLRRVWSARPPNRALPATSAPWEAQSIPIPAPWPHPSGGSAFRIPRIPACSVLLVPPKPPRLRTDVLPQIQLFRGRELQLPAVCPCSPASRAAGVSAPSSISVQRAPLARTCCSFPPGIQLGLVRRSWGGKNLGKTPSFHPNISVLQDRIGLTPLSFPVHLFGAKNSLGQLVVVQNSCSSLPLPVFPCIPILREARGSGSWAMSLQILRINPILPSPWARQGSPLSWLLPAL